MRSSNTRRTASACHFHPRTTEIHKVPDTIISRCQALISSDYLWKISSKNFRNCQEGRSGNRKRSLGNDRHFSGRRDERCRIDFSPSNFLEDKKITAKEVEEILGTTKHQNVEKMSNFFWTKKPERRWNWSMALLMKGMIWKYSTNRSELFAPAFDHFSRRKTFQTMALESLEQLEKPKRWRKKDRRI